MPGGEEEGRREGGEEGRREARAEEAPEQEKNSSPLEASWEECRSALFLASWKTPLMRAAGAGVKVWVQHTAGEVSLSGYEACRAKSRPTLLQTKQSQIAYYNKSIPCLGLLLQWSSVYQARVCGKAGSGRGRHGCILPRLARCAATGDAEQAVTAGDPPDPGDPGKDGAMKTIPR